MRPGAFSAAAHVVIDLLPDGARIELEVGLESPWLVVQPLAAEVDRARRARGIAEVKQALELTPGKWRARLDVVLGDRRATLYGTGEGRLSGSGLLISIGAASAAGADYDGPDEAAADMLDTLDVDLAKADAADHLRDGDPRPGRYARNGRPRGLLGRRFGPPRDEGAWDRRLREIRDELELVA